MHRLPGVGARVEAADAGPQVQHERIVGAVDRIRVPQRRRLAPPDQVQVGARGADVQAVLEPGHGVGVGVVTVAPAADSDRPEVGADQPAPAGLPLLEPGFERRHAPAFTESRGAGYVADAATGRASGARGTAAAPSPSDRKTRV